MKRFGTQLHAKSLVTISFILLIATLMSCLLVFPASAASYPRTTDQKKIYTDNTERYVMGRCLDEFTVETETKTMSWTAKTISEEDYTYSITRGNAQVAVWYLSNSGYYVAFDETIETTGVIDGGKKYYVTTGFKSYSSSAVFPYIQGYGIGGMVNYMHMLATPNQGERTGNYYITFTMSSKTSRPIYTNHNYP